LKSEYLCCILNKTRWNVSPIWLASIYFLKEALLPEQEPEMKPGVTGAASGCIVSIILFSIFSCFLVPLSMFVASFSSTMMPDLVLNVLAPYLCPADSTPFIFTYATTMRDQNNFDVNATAYEMQCVDAAGNVVKEPSPNYAFIWTGIMAVTAVIISAVLTLLLAAPAGVLIARIRARSKKSRENPSA